MKALAKVRDSICENGEICHAINQLFLASFGASVIALSIVPLA